jgi:hypothetical protein
MLALSVFGSWLLAPGLALFCLFFIVSPVHDTPIFWLVAFFPVCLSVCFLGLEGLCVRCDWNSPISGSAFHHFSLHVFVLVAARFDVMGIA